MQVLLKVLSGMVAFLQEVIPYLNEHMEDSCSPDLLGYIRNLVLSRIQVNEEQVILSLSY